ncbi:hypothetical protein [Cryobacterium sp. PH31-L1]|uniref:hypothetical protein n=1 Tax=Cryobacterium sp. PH31-L1 TaxID=3046199 RepID=UPI0024BB6894|nr:hypothetical protein [Cryobacterium sp. PH31-L1]MDJ0377596.1 hypothetical protein [Cryobacterium sp. PH31-L1]
MTATIRVDCDRDRWLYVPEEWPWNQFAHLDDWAGTVTGLLTDAHSLDPQTARWIDESLHSIANDRPETESRFVYLANPAEYIFFVSVLYPASSPELTLDDLAAVHDPAATSPVTATTFSSELLGDGVRSIRYADVGEPDHDIAAIAQYAWKGDDLDVVVIAANFNIALLTELLPIVDDLARSISIVLPERSHGGFKAGPSVDWSGGSQSSASRASR